MDAPGALGRRSRRWRAAWARDPLFLSAIALIAGLSLGATVAAMPAAWWALAAAPLALLPAIAVRRAAAQEARALAERRRASRATADWDALASETRTEAAADADWRRVSRTTEPGAEDAPAESRSDTEPTRQAGAAGDRVEY